MYFDKVRIPGIATDMKVIVSMVFSRGLAENVSCKIGKLVAAQCIMTPRDNEAARGLGMGVVGRQQNVRYFDARTNRPAMTALATVLGGGWLEIDQKERQKKSRKWLHRSACFLKQSRVGGPAAICQELVSCLWGSG